MSNHRNGFWGEAFAIHGSITPLVIPYVLGFGVIAAGVCLLAWGLESALDVRMGIQVAPYELAGAALGLLLILRTNAGYDRWWEARKLWGGVVNQSRNLVISGLAYGPTSSEWQKKFVHWAAALPHVIRCRLRGQPPSEEVVALLGSESAAEVASANHPPSFVALQLAHFLREAHDSQEMSSFAFLQVDKERALLIDHAGACERILKTPLPKVYAIKIRRFIMMFLVTLPFALLHRMDSFWQIPLITMLVAYPLMSLDQIGVELQNPFSERNLSHLPLGEISATIEGNLLDLLAKLEESSTTSMSQ